MPLTANTDGVKAKITAVVGNVDANIVGDVQTVKAGVTARLMPSARYYVPLRLGVFDKTDGFLPNGMTYVDDGKKSYSLGLDKMKEMNTKIVYVEDLTKVDRMRLVKGDYIYLKN